MAQVNRWRDATLRPPTLRPVVMARLVRATHDLRAAGQIAAPSRALGVSEIMGPPDKPGDDEQEIG
jgi:hypothetical protein